MSIPIHNIYYLLLYAWGHVQQDELARLDSMPTTQLHDLLAHVLADHVGRLIARGLPRDYVPISEVVRGVRGKLDLAVTLKRNLLADARTFCFTDDFRHDVPRNRIVKATLRRLLRLQMLDGGVRERVRKLYLKLDGVAEVELRRGDFRVIQTHRHAGAYEFILRLCLLIFDSIILDATTGDAVFADFQEDKARMSALFESFVYNFYRLEQDNAKVSRPHIRWHDAQGSEHDLARLPIMRTDVVLQSAENCLVLDAKYYRRALREYRGRERIRSSHLYQLFAYLENLSAPSSHIRYEGMLLYPVVELPFAYTYCLKGHRIAIRSINLAQSWRRIRGDMLELLQSAKGLAA